MVIDMVARHLFFKSAMQAKKGERTLIRILSLGLIEISVKLESFIRKKIVNTLLLNPYRKVEPTIYD